MGWQERRYSGDDEGGVGGSLRRALRRIFVEGGSFFSWALPLFTVFGVRVRIHVVFILIIVGELLMSMRTDGLGLGYTATGIGALFVLVLLHEFGHVAACRWVKGEADEILMWPLGGLAFCRAPHTWGASLITTLGGPAVNVALVPVLGGVVWGLTRNWVVVVFNPFSPGFVLAGVALRDGTHAYWLVLIWWLYYTNLVLLGFNVLLPMYPMDGGRIVQEVLWWRVGYTRSMHIAVNVGLALAVMLGVLALVGGESLLFGVALFAALTCYDQRRRLAFMDEELLAAEGGGGVASGVGSWHAAEDARRKKRAAKEREREAQRQAEVDRILAKIARTGMGSLTRKEKAILRGETERQQGR